MNQYSYNDNKLKFILPPDEIKMLDDIWNFMDEFIETKLTRNAYHKYCIEKIKNKYNVDEFYRF
jgi:hypothetical protein